MKWVMQPLGPWTGPVTPARRSRYTFKAPWPDTKALLEYEVDHLGGTRIVLQVDVRADQVRQDGTFRANVSVGPFPGVRVTFESAHGPLTYATDAHELWQHNVRAIALALQALRAVDRYGVSGRGEQYRGWTAIESRPAQMTRQAAAELLADLAAPTSTERLLAADPAAIGVVYRKAARLAHPDLGGSAELMARVNAARDLLLAGGGV